MLETGYSLSRENNKLLFRTSSFKAEKTSVLHEGVYTKEFASMLFASAACIFSYMVSDFLSAKSPIIRYIFLIIIFVISFLGSNKLIFKDMYLEAVFDKSNSTAYITRSGLLGRKTEKISFSNIKSVEASTRKYTPENLDGIDFVQKISAQHGSPVPGLSEDEEFITLRLLLQDGSDRHIYAVKTESGHVDGEPGIPLNEIRNFIFKT